jgi:hypothetical protein
MRRGGDPLFPQKAGDTTDQLETIALYDLDSRVARVFLPTHRSIHGDDLSDAASLHLALSQTEFAGTDSKIDYTAHAGPSISPQSGRTQQVPQHTDLHRPRRGRAIAPSAEDSR